MIPDLDPMTDLSFTRTLSVPRQLIWECWTKPEHIPHFFIPAPHKVTAVEIDLRVGGRFNTTFDVDGNVMDNKGVYLDLVPGEKLVFTDTYYRGLETGARSFHDRDPASGRCARRWHDLHRDCPPPHAGNAQGA